MPILTIRSIKMLLSFIYTTILSIRFPYESTKTNRSKKKFLLPLENSKTTQARYFMFQ